jgi:hypothetical protein
MMKNFMASGSLARGMEVDEVPNEGDTTPFPREDGWPSLVVCRVSNPSLGTPARCGWGTRMREYKDTNYLVEKRQQAR